MRDAWRDNAESRFAYEVAFEGTTVAVRGDIAPPPARPEPDAVPGASTRRFRRGLGGYDGAADTALRERAPGAACGAEPSLSVDADDPPGSGGASQVLLRFGDLFGAGPGRVPREARIARARLVLEVTNEGHGLRLHAMLADWDERATWDALAGGVAPDGREAETEPVAAAGGIRPRAVPRGPLELDVTASLRTWQAGAANLGWLAAPLPGGRDGLDFDSSDAPREAARPTLVVEYLE